MNDTLKSLIVHLRLALGKKADGITIGKFAPGSSAASSMELNPLHAAFLGICDGGRFGAVDLWSLSELAEKRFQYRAEWQPGGLRDWVEIGQVLYEPVFLRRMDGVIYLPSVAGEAVRTVSDLDVFLEDYVFGGKYAQLYDGADQNRWNVFLMSLQGNG